MLKVASLPFIRRGDSEYVPLEDVEELCKKEICNPSDLKKMIKKTEQVTATEGEKQLIQKSRPFLKYLGEVKIVKFSEI